MKRGMLIVTIGLFALTSYVDAKAYYTNKNGVEMTQIQYEKMAGIFSERKIENLTQIEFDKYKDKEVADSGILYEKTSYLNGEVLSQEYISEEEYNRASDIENSCSPYSDTFQELETSYKRLAAQLFTDNSVLATLTWKKIPVYKSYDIFGMRFQFFNYLSFGGTQDYYIGNTGYRINYDMSSPGFKAQSTGFGISMNLKDGDDIEEYGLLIESQLGLQETTSKIAHVYVSYQHAQANLTREQSMSYSMSISGLGGVFLFSDPNIEAYYDDMTGLHLVRDLS